MKKLIDSLQISMSSHVIMFTRKEMAKQTDFQRKGLIWRLVRGNFWNREKKRYMNFIIDPSISLSLRWEAHNTYSTFFFNNDLDSQMAPVLLTDYKPPGSPFK